MTNPTEWEIIPDECEDDEETLSAGELYADLMAGFADMESYRRGLTPVRVTQLINDEYRTFWTFADGPAADHYNVVIGRMGEHGFKAYVPQLSGCAATGGTQAEALANIRAAIDAWIEAAVGDGRDIPVPSELAIAA